MLRRAIQTTRGRLVLLLSAVGAVILGTAVVDHLIFDRYDTFGAALWSAVLHLLDPSSLQEDEGAVERTIGVFQVVTGLVLLVGVLFTLVADSVGRSLARLGASDMPVRARGHLLIAGGVDQLGVATGAEAIAADLGIARPHIVVLAPEAARQTHRGLIEELRERVAPLRVDLVFGDTAADSGFALGAAEHAAKVLLLPSTGGPTVAEAADVEVMQAGLALKEYLDRHGANPDVRLLFRRGRHVDAVWDLFPPDWDAVVGDRIVAALLRVAITRLEDVPEAAYLVNPKGTGDSELVRRARERAAAEGRPMRITMVGCGITAPAQMEDLAGEGPGRFDITVVAERRPFEVNLGREDPAGIRLRLAETDLSDPELLKAALEESRPDLVLVTPSPLEWNLRVADAEATLTLLHVLRSVGQETPVLAELFLPESVSRLPDDPRLLPLSALQAIAGALALSLFDPARSREIERSLGAPGT